MQETGAVVPARPGGRLPDLEALRSTAHELAVMADQLHLGWCGEPVAGAPGPEPDADAETAIDRLLKDAEERPHQLRSSFGSEPHDGAFALLDRLHHGLLARRSAVQILFPRSLAADRKSLAQLLTWSERGAQVRMHPCNLPTLAVLDGSLGIICCTGRYGRHIGVVRNADETQAMQTLHSALWSQSADVSVLHDVLPGDTQDGVALKTLRMLSLGYTDERASRELGVSLRTYRRRVADLMERLGAGSRFQAGMRAAQLGLIGGPLRAAHGPHGAHASTRLSEAGIARRNPQ